MREKWWDAEYMVEAQKNAIDCTYFGGDAFAWFFPNFGTDWFSGLLGANVSYTEYYPGCPPFKYTAWAEPFVNNWDDHIFTFDESSFLWKKMYSLMELVLKESNGEYMVGFPDLIGGIDCMSAIRGAEKLCLDLIDQPEIIKLKMMEINAFFKETYNKLFRILNIAQGCASATLPAWFDGRYFCHINDFSA